MYDESIDVPNAEEVRSPTPESLASNLSRNDDSKSKDPPLSTRQTPSRVSKPSYVMSVKTPHVYNLPNALPHLVALASP